jgi:hypothetical protein
MNNILKRRRRSVGAVDPWSNTKSIIFDGSDDKIELDEVTWGYGTLSLWFKTGEEDHIPLSIGTGQFVYLANKMYVNWPKVDGYLTYNYSGYDDNSWHHLVATFDASAAKMYYDGSLVETNTNLDTASTTDDLRIGVYGASGMPYEGNLDEISWWANTTLDAGAVEAIYNSGAPINLAADSGNYDNSGDLTNWWRMGDGDTYPTIQDQVGSLDGTMTNMTSGDIVTDTP